MSRLREHELLICACISEHINIYNKVTIFYFDIAVYMKGKKNHEVTIEKQTCSSRLQFLRTLIRLKILIDTHSNYHGILQNIKE